LAITEKPFFITQNGDASMVIESVAPFQEKESLIATLKIIALGEKGCGNNWCHHPPPS